VRARRASSERGVGRAMTGTGVRVRDGQAVRELGCRGTGHGGD